MTTRVPSIPNLTEDNVQQVLSAAKEIIEVREGVRGDPLDKAVTFRDLEALKLVEQTEQAEQKISMLPVQVLPAVNPVVFGPDDYDESSDLNTPPAGFNLEATGGYSAIYLSWEYPPYRNHAYTEIYRSTVNDLTTAALIGSTPGNLYSDPVGTEVTAYYWIRIVSQANVKSEFNSTGGVIASTAIDISREFERFSNELQSLPLFNDLATGIASLESAQQSFVSQIATIEANSAALNNTVVAIDGQNRSAIQIQANAIAGLGGQYSVKIDNNGHVAGFGLSNTPVNGTPTSAFIVRVDKFAIVHPLSTLNNLTNNPSSDTIPFYVNQGGTYIKSAFIEDATITNAKIQSVSADKITTGTITAAVDMRSPLIRSGAVSYGQAGFFLGNDGGTNKFYIGNGSTGTSGRELSFNGTDVTVRGTVFAYAGQISNVTANNVTATNLTILDSSGNTLLASGSGVRAQDLLNSFVTLSGLGAGAFASVSQLTPWNITSYIQSGAIGQALIANAAIGSAQIQDGSITNAKIQNASITSAKIEDLAVTAAKIGNAQVETLKIAGQAVTVPAYTFGNTADLTLNYSIGGAQGEMYQLFILGSLVQSFYSQIYMTINGVQLWGEQPLAGTLATRGVVFSVFPGFYQVRLYSTDGRNTNGTSIYVLATKR